MSFPKFNIINTLEFISFKFIVHIDVTRVFNNALLQQTQHYDSHGDKTIASSYTQW